jgi:hypothetical protein
VSRGEELDGRTVNLLENRCPKYSERDRTFLRGRLDAGELFGTVINPTAKEEMWIDLCAYDYLVPSIRTFFKNRVYLDYLARSVRLLIEKPHKTVSGWTVRSRLRSIFSRSSTDIVQVSDTCFEETPSVNDEKAFMLAYQQVWLCAMRMWPGLVNGHPRMTPAASSEDKPVRVEDGRSTLSNFAHVAHRLGFRSAHIQSLFTGSLTASSTDEMQTVYVTEESSQRDVDDRSGVPMDSDFSIDASSLYFRNISRACELPGYDITTLFSRRSFFKSIFSGDDIEVAGPDNASPPARSQVTPSRQAVVSTPEDCVSPAPMSIESSGDTQIATTSSDVLNTTNRKRKTAADICTFKIFETPQLQVVHVPFDQRNEYARSYVQRSDTMYTAKGSRLHLSVLEHSPHIDVVYVRGPQVTEEMFREKLGFSADREINFRHKQIRRR